MEVGIHSLVHGSVNHGGSCKIGCFCIIEEDVILGNDVSISDYVKIPKGAVIGDGSVIGSYVRLGKNCYLGNRVQVKCHAVISPDTLLEDGVFIGPNAIVLHATPSGEHKPCLIKREVFVGTGVYINPGVTIHEGIVIGSGAVVTKTLTKPGVYLGNPAKLTRIPVIKK
jgi:acetyltransferase-like isoleucine patch superfamily enzyme